MILSKKQYVLERDFFLELLKRLPAHVFWKNKDGVYLGCNDAFAHSLGLSVEEIIGKNDYDLPIKKGDSNIYRKDDKQIIETRQPKLNIEEEQTFSDGRKAYLLTSKVPLLNKNKAVIGVLGIYQDITKLKKIEQNLIKARQSAESATRLKLENETHKRSLQEQKKFITIANQVAHDIRSPVASLLMIIKSCTDIPEPERIALREVASSINDIANSLLNRFRLKGNRVEISNHHSALVSVTLLQLLTDKKYEYQTVAWMYEVGQAAYFSFISIDPSSFKRMFSNLINNSVEALKNERGEIKITLNATKKNVSITIQDRGKGMPPELVSKINRQVAIASRKKTGHGLGLAQVQETLSQYRGKINVESTLGRGTSVTLTFPRMPVPNWIADTINLTSSDLIVILDDDNSIHVAWDTHFEPILKKFTYIRLKHFVQAKEALRFLNSLSSDLKQEVFLLTDYELLKQKLNGLQVIENSQIQRAILVTSHYAHPKVLDVAEKMGIKILPKQLASEVTINVKAQKTAVTRKNLKRVDRVLVDNDTTFSQHLSLFAFGNEVVDRYEDPHTFLAQIAKYAKHTKIYLDYHFATADLNGVDIARRLHGLGYRHLYLLSGQDFEPTELPSYLILLRKDKIEAIKQS